MAKKANSAPAKKTTTKTPRPAARKTARTVKRPADEPIVNAESAVATQTGTGTAMMDPAECVRVCAYYKWEAAGCPEGDGSQFWLDAEREILNGDATGASQPKRRKPQAK